MNEAIVLLVLLWAVVLVPGAVRSRRTSPHHTVGGFERAMDVLRNKPSVGRELMVPSDAGRIVTRDVTRAEPAGPYRREDPVTSRRRSWFVRLLVGTGATFLLAVAFGGWLWLPFLAAALVSGGYTALLRHLKVQRDEARRVVREIDLRDADDVGIRRAEEPVAAGGSAVRLRRWDA